MLKINNKDIDDFEQTFADQMKFVRLSRTSPFNKNSSKPMKVTLKEHMKAVQT